MTDFIIGAILWWLLFGTLVWAFCDPAHVFDVATRRFVLRKGRLPRPGAVFLATVILVVLWPKLAMAMWRRG